MAAVKGEEIMGASSGGGGGVGSGDNVTRAISTISSTATSSLNIGGGSNTVSAAADSNQPSPPLHAVHGGDQMQNPQLKQQKYQQQQQQHSDANVYDEDVGGQHLFESSPGMATSTSANSIAQMYPAGSYNTRGDSDLQQQVGLEYSSYPSCSSGYVATYHNFLNNYEQYPEQSQSLLPSSSSAANTPSIFNYENPTSSGGDPLGFSAPSTVSYHAPYMNHFAMSMPVYTAAPVNASSGGSSTGNVLSTATSHLDDHSSGAPQHGVGVNSATKPAAPVSPRLVSSTSPSSTSTVMGAALNKAECKSQCKKCGAIFASDVDLSEHMTAAHGYSGYLVEPRQSVSTVGDILDLDSQKMVYPPKTDSASVHDHLQSHVEPSSPLVTGADSLQSIPAMQQRSISGWRPSDPAALTPFMRMEMEKDGGGCDVIHNTYYQDIKSEFPAIKAEFEKDSGYLGNDAAGDVCTRSTSMTTQPLPSSPAEFPSTTTSQEQQQQHHHQQQQQQYHGFETPSSSSSVLPSDGVAAPPPSWKSNDARRPKTYYCTACKKWFTSSGHLKRHYNTMLHKNAVKTSGQPDPVLLPVATFHHPERDPTSKLRNQNRRLSAAAQQKKKQQSQAGLTTPTLAIGSAGTEHNASSPDYSQTGTGQVSHYSSSPSPTQSNGISSSPYAQTQDNGDSPVVALYQQQQQQQQQQQSTPVMISGSSIAHKTVMNVHPNGLAGPSVHLEPPITPSSQTRGLLKTTIAVKSESIEDNSQLKMEITGMDKEIGDRHRQQQEHCIMLGTLPSVPSTVQRHQLIPHTQQQQIPHTSSSNSSSNSNIICSNNMSSLIISQQWCPEPSLPQTEDNIFCRILSPLPQPQRNITPPTHIQRHIMEAAAAPAYNLIPLAIHTPRPRLLPLPPNNSNTQPLQLPSTTAITNSMQANMQATTVVSSQRPQEHHQPSPEDYQHLPTPMLPMPSNTLLNSTTTTTTASSNISTLQPLLLQQQLPSRLDTHSTTNRTATTTPLNTIPSFQYMHKQTALAATAPLEPSTTYHTIIGSIGDKGSNNVANVVDSIAAELHAINGGGHNNNNVIQLSTLEPFGTAMAEGHHVLQMIPTAQIVSQPIFTLPSHTSFSRCLQRSPQEADLPPKEANADEHMTVSATEAATPTSAMTLMPSVDQMDYGGITNAANILHESVVQLVTVDSGSDPGSITILNDIGDIDEDSITNPNDAADGRRSASSRKSKRSRTTHFNGGARDVGHRSKRNKPIGTISPDTTTLSAAHIKCVECNKEFTRICYLTQHNNTFHSGECPYRCQKCGKRFHSEKMYTKHLGRHSAIEKPYKCEQCPKQFHHKTDLRRHIEAIHTGFKQHVCDICEKSFCRKDHLRKHRETHTKPRVVTKKMLRLKTAPSGEKRAEECGAMTDASAVSVVAEDGSVGSNGGEESTNGMHVQLREKIEEAFSIAMDSDDDNTDIENDGGIQGGEVDEGDGHDHGLALASRSTESGIDGCTSSSFHRNHYQHEEKSAAVMPVISEVSMLLLPNDNDDNDANASSRGVIADDVASRVGDNDDDHDRLQIMIKDDFHMLGNEMAVIY